MMGRVHSHSALRSGAARIRTRASVLGSLRAAAILVLSLAGVCGCSTLFAVPRQQASAGDYATIHGTVEGPRDADGPLVVGLLAAGTSGYHLVDYFVAEQPGAWAFAVRPGTYFLAAFADVDGDGRYHDEPALRPDPARAVVLGPGEQLADVRLEIPQTGRFGGDFELKEVFARTPQEQRRRSLLSLSVAGKITTLDDPRFSREVASSGIWKYYDFVSAEQAGIYFLEKYDPTRVPVLFVHGMGGTPSEFRDLIESLDRTRFQAWVFYYPSGARLDTVVAVLAQLFARLRVEYRFQRAAVVAHSMGGLVAREFLLRDAQTSGSTAVRAFVTISSPFGGMESAGTGVERSPVVVHSWRDIPPGSEFLDGLYYRDVPNDTERRRLPEHIAHHMLFGFKGKSGDGVVSVESALRPEAQEEARSIRGFDEDHTSILRSPAAAARLNEILATL
jgi:pimeloyl-ACP methyl ester carboxylesterase